MTDTPAPDPVQLDMTMTATGEFAKPGAIVKYTIVIENNDYAAAYNIAIWDELPEFLRYVRGGPEEPDIDGNMLRWELDGLTLEPGEQFIISFEVEILSIPGDLPFVNEAFADYNDPYYKDPARHPQITSGKVWYLGDTPIVYPNPFCPGTAVGNKLKIINMTKLS